MTIKGSFHVSVPIVKRFSAENFLFRQNLSQNDSFFSRKWGTEYYFLFSKHTRGTYFVFVSTYCWGPKTDNENQFCDLGCRLFEEPKNEHVRSYISPIWGENPWSNLDKILH